MTYITRASFINYLIVLYAFFIPLSRAALTGISILLFTLWIFNKDLKKNISFLISNNVILYLILFIFFNVLSLLWTNNVESGLFYIKKYWYFLPLFVIASSINRQYITYTISAFLIGMLLSEIVSYGIFFELWTFKKASVNFPNPFMHHIQYSMFLAFTSLLLLNRFFHEQTLKSKIIYILFFLITTVSLFFNSGRTGQISFVVSIFVVAFLNIKNKILAFLGIFSLIITILLTSYNISPNFKNRFDEAIRDIDKMSAKSDYNTSLGLRAGAWKIGIEIFLENPIAGIGITNDMNMLKDTISQKYPHMNDVKQILHYHNFYIQTAVHLGAIGVFLYIMIFYNILKLNIKDRKYFNLSVIFIVIFSLVNITENIFHQKFSQALFALFVGLFIAQNRIEQNT
ncbi:MAG: O-antigen ligase family protein [Sulfurimonas sp.]|jgi:O-antigen ligase